MYLKEGLNDGERIYRNYRKKTNGHLTATTGLFELARFYRKNRIYGKDIETKVANTIFKEFNRLIAKQIVYKGFEFQLPKGLGKIRIATRKKVGPTINKAGKVKVRRSVNFNETKKLWASDPEAKKERRKIYMTWGDDSFYYRWYWDKTGHYINNKDVFSFLPTRTNKKLILQATKSSLYKIEYLK